MTQIEAAGLAWVSFALAGKAIFPIALSSTDSAIPTARFRIAQYLSGSGSPSYAVFILSRVPPSGLRNRSANDLCRDTGSRQIRQRRCGERAYPTALVLRPLQSV